MKPKKQMLIVLCAACLPVIAHADDPANSTYSWAYNCPPPPPPPCPPNTPLDGGLSILAAAGVGYGVKRYAAKKKKQKEENSEDSI